MQPPIHPNPYTPPTAPLGFGPDEAQRYEFHAEVLESDVHRATRRLGRFVLGFSFLSCILLLSFILIILSLSPRNLPVILYFVPASLFFLVLLLRMTWINIGPGAGRIRVRATPLIVGNISGTITDSEIRINTEKSSTIHPLKSCSFAEVRSDTLVFAFDQRRLFLHVLPRHAFAAGCFERAAKLLIQNALASKVSPANGVIDQRLLSVDQFFQIEMPSDGVAFSGPITSRDVMASPLRLQATKAKWIIIGTIVLLIVLPLLIVFFLLNKLRMEIGIVIFVFFLFLALRLSRTYRVNLKWTKSPEQVLMQSRGVINRHALYVSTPTGASIYRWDIFTEATLQDELMSFALPGKFAHRVLISRRQFASDNEWSQAKEIIRECGHLFPIICD